MKSRLAFALGLSALLALGALLPLLRSNAKAADLPQLGPVPPFTLTDEQGRSFGSVQLRGHPYLADFIFTGCHESCPLLTARMAEIQAQTTDLPQALHLVTFTVDPGRDTPERLRDYARQAGADPARWTFLTGPAAVLSSLLNDGFKVAMDKTPSAKTPIHDNHLVLVDGTGQIRGYFTPDAEGLKAVRWALKRLWAP
jgi:protein SCO1/2